MNFLQNLRAAAANRSVRAVMGRVRDILEWQPFTLRGLVAIIAALILVVQYAIPSSDLMASLLGEAILVLALLAAIFAFTLRIRLRRNLFAELHFDAADRFARRDIPSGIVLTNSSVLPYFSLRLTRKFERPGADSAVHVVKGREHSGRRHLVDSVWFPHRGMWIINGLRVEINDVLGVTKFSWTIPCRGEIEISAPTIDIQPLPVVAASSQSGDQLHHAKERSGDLFDIKQYDPSDGAKRILWKTFAKSGQLVVRRPEPAIVPEGEVAAYLVAGTEDDHVAGALQGYFKQLHDHNIVVLFGTDGFMFDSPLVETSPNAAAPVKSSPPAAGSGQTGFFCSDPEEIQHAINRSVWSKHSGSGQGFESYMADLANHAKQIHHVLIFAPEPIAGIRSWQTAQSVDWVERITRVCSVHQVKLSIALVPAELAAPRQSTLKSEALDFARAAKWLAQPANWDLRTRLKPGANPVPTAPRRLANEISRAGAELLEIRAYR